MKTQGEVAPKLEEKAFERTKWYVGLVFSSIALCLSIGSFLFSIYGTPGSVKPFKPSGYGIIREIGSFPSDHLILPIEWQNTSGKPVLIRHPYLILRELGSDGKETKNEVRFILAGEYAEISTNSFKERYSIKTSFALESHSISTKILVFHIEKWWDKTDPLYTFHFKTGQKYNVYIGFYRNLKEQPETFFYEMLLYDRTDILDRKIGDWWDYWNIE